VGAVAPVARRLTEPDPRAAPSGATYDPGMTRLIITSLVAVGALALAAPTFAASPSEWAKSADKICAKAKSDIDKIAKPTSTKELISSSEKIMKIGKSQTKDLKKLKRPSGDAAAIEKLIGYYEQQVDVVKDLIDAVKHEDKSKLEKTIKKGDELNKSAESLATKLGAKKCAL